MSLRRKGIPTADLDTQTNRDLSILSLDLPDPIRRSLFRSGVRWVKQVDDLSDAQLALKGGMDHLPDADLREWVCAAVERLRREGRAEKLLTEPALYVPSVQASRPLGALGLPVRPANVLKQHGFRILADLHGLTGSVFLSMRGMGHESLVGLLDALSAHTAVGGVRPLAAAFLRTDGRGPVATADDRSSGTIDLTGLSFPGTSRHWGPTPKCDLWRSRTLFRHLGVDTIGELLQMADADHVIVGTRRHMAAARHIRSVSDLLLIGLEAGTFQSVDGKPNLPARALVKAPAAVARAQTVSEEIGAVLQWVAEQNKTTVRQRWTCTSGRFPTLDEVGQARGVTRERARQIVTRAEQDLLDSHIWLPRTARLLRHLALKRERWTVAQIRGAFAEHGEVVSEADVRLFPTLARVGAIPACECDQDDLIRLSPSAATVRKARKESEALESRVTSSLYELERNGWLAQADDCDADAVLTQLLRQRLRRSRKRPMLAKFVAVDGAVIPNPSMPSSLTRWVARRLYVAGAMSLDALFKRMALFTQTGYGQRLNLRLPSRAVFETMLAWDPRFNVADRRVQLHAAQDDGDPLTPAERTLVEAVRRLGGSIDYQGLVTLAEENGLSIASVALFTQGPLLDRVRKAHYRLPSEG